MVRIIKTMQAKHTESLSPWIKDYRTAACSVALPLLPQHLASFPKRWPFPRGDLYHWISLLNRFDVILERFCKSYKLDDGPQIMDFGCTLLESRVGEPEGNLDSHNLETLGLAKDGDRVLIESILNFSRMLLQNCANRSIYASSSHLNHLLNSTSLSLLESTLRLGSELAQRYQAALKRMSMPVRHVSNALLANHYNIDLDRVLQLALPFTKVITTQAEAHQPTTPVTPTIKGKEKGSVSASTPSQKPSTTIISVNDLVSMVKGGNGLSTTPKTSRNAAETKAEVSWEQWGDVKVTYYPKTVPDRDASENTFRSTNLPIPNMPTTPTPTRRTSNLGLNGQRSNRHTSSDEPSSPVPRASTFPLTTDETLKSSFKVIEISSSELKSAGVHTLLRDNLLGLPKESQYELLTKLRVAEALTSTLETRRQILAVRLLAITNLAYVHSETTFQETVLKQDNEEPRRIRLSYQLAELVHPPAEGGIAIPIPLQTLAFSALDALSQHQTKFPDVCAALNTTVNHGVLLYITRKAVAEMGVNDEDENFSLEDEWRDALFSLLSSLCVTPRTAGDLVTAGLIPILIQVLALRTFTAELYQPKVLNFLDTIMYSTRDSFQTLVASDGLDALSDLIVYEVQIASDRVASGKGMRPEHRSAAVDYDIPYYHQQTLKWLFKFVHHMMSAAGGYGGNFDRLLRNLIDSATLLKSLRQVIGSSHCFGSIVWTNAVAILNDFINNEPTSFAIIAEAGLSRGLLEAVTGSPIALGSDSAAPESQGNDRSLFAVSPPSIDAESEDEIIRPSLALVEAPREGPLARGIMPTSESINIIPQAFGAICLNNAGMKMFQNSKALDSFFEIFESPEHVKCMDVNKDLPAHLGSTFDELVRHHPPLKGAIMTSILNMVARVAHLCKTKAEKHKVGAKLWTTDSSGNFVVADQQITQSLDKAFKGKERAVDDGVDIEMRDIESEITDHVPSSPASNMGPNSSMTPYITAVATFLLAMFSNSSVRSEFSSKGGIEPVLDLVDSPCLAYDFGDGPASRTLQLVVSMLADPKPHLTIPSILRRLQNAVDTLEPLANHSDLSSFFAPFVSSDSHRSADSQLLSNGTAFAKALVNIQSLLLMLTKCFQQSPYNHRSANNSFNQLNMADYYVRLIRSLGPLLGASLREELHLEKSVPESWKSSVRVRDSGFGELAVDVDSGTDLALSPGENSNNDITSGEGRPQPSNGESVTPVALTGGQLSDKKPKLPTKTEQESGYFKNFHTLRYLLSRMPRIVSPFFQTLGKNLVPKRHPDPFQKQGNASIAEALADTILQGLKSGGEEISEENYIYWKSMLHILKNVLIEDSPQNERHNQTMTLVLQAFKDRDGFTSVNHILDVFTEDIRSSSAEEIKTNPKIKERLERATSGTIEILSLYGNIVGGKNVAESVQTVSMTTRGDKDRTKPDFFAPSQFLVELRMSVLPTLRRLWSSDLVEKGSSKISKQLIDVIRIIASADNESHAVKRSDKVVIPSKSSRKPFKPNSESLETLNSQGYEHDVAVEALYRCNNSIVFSIEYCRELDRGTAGRNPIPNDDTVSSPDANGSSRPRTSASTGSATPDDNVLAMSIDNLDNGSAQMPPPPPPTTGTISDQAIGQSAGQIPELDPQNPSPDSLRNSNSNVTQWEPFVAEGDRKNQVTVDDLNEERDAIRDNLIDRCLDVINSHGEVTFEVSDLITTVVSKSADPEAQRKAVGETLAVALMSFAGEDDIRTCGKKIASYAHLLALMLRDKLFYTAAVGELKENLSTFLSFVKLSPSHSVDEPSPWVSQILLIIEMLLSEDAKPKKTKWTAPKTENDAIEQPVLEEPVLIVGQEERDQLLEAILDIIPRIGKDEALALAVLRILVILTRTRSMAQYMGEKKNIQRLFVMAKQLAGASSSRIHSPLMLILRHIIEDDDTVKQIMRADIKMFFENARSQRSLDPATYLRALAHTAVRSPQIFVEATNEMVQYNRWSWPSSDVPSRNTALVLKEKAVPESKGKNPDDSVQPTVRATEDLSIQDVKLSTEAGDKAMPDTPKPALVEQKLPLVENPDGVIHFLLCEILNYRDVEDKEATVSPPTTGENKSLSPSNGDVTMGGTPISNSSMTASPVPDLGAPKDPKASKQNSKQDFKTEDHPIYIYRCFILQCLAELLSSYNRTKIEFINFKRSAPPQAMTPSKPRSSVVNYLLSDLIPVGTLDHAESTILRKKTVTSSWADSVLTALLNKTDEHPVDKDAEPYGTENEPDLLFVRRFVLENVLKAYREAGASSEDLDVKYARMLALADLMSHIMSGKESVMQQNDTISTVSQKQLRRIMFDKGFVGALTASIADIDLNFPGAKRAVKYILRPLKVLTLTAVNLSRLELLSPSSGQIEEEEIESATSVSDLEEEREETPDLFRNSTLGMFEPGREADSSSESDDEDEEMYEGEYDDEMEYEEEMGEDDDNISDEDEEIEGIGPIEGLSGDHGVDVEVIMDEDEDEDDEDDDTSNDEEDHAGDPDSERDDHVEIIDPDGHIQHIHETDDMEEDWESDEEEDHDPDDDYEGDAVDQEDEHIHLDDLSNPISGMLREYAGHDAAFDIMERLEAGGLDPGPGMDDPLVGEYMEGMDDEEDEEDEDDMEEEELMFGQYPFDAPAGQFDFEVQDGAESPLGLHRHRPPHGGLPPVSVFPGGRDPLGGMSTPLSLTDRVREARQLSRRLQETSRDFPIRSNRTDSNAVPDFRQSYRSHRPGGPPLRSADEGINPLLRRETPVASRDGPGRPPTMGTWIQAMGGPAPELLDIGLSGRPFGESPAAAALLDEVIRSLPPLPGHIARNGASLQFHIASGPTRELPGNIQMILGGRNSRFEPRRDATDPGSASFFIPQSTGARWLEEAKILYGSSYLERACDIVNAISAVLTPPAIEAAKALKAAEAERARKIDEEVKRRVEEERAVREAKEAQDQAAREEKEAQERDAAYRAAADALAEQGPETECTEAEGTGMSAATTVPERMDGIEADTQLNREETQANDDSAADRPRVTTMIRGSSFDITDLGIDPEFLAELPEEIREEVIMSAVAERRSQAAAQGTQPSDIDQEFLDALPDDIRQEIMQQERQDRRRREREERNRQAAAANPAAPPDMDMDVASILATLEPALRSQVLREQDEETLAQLPPEIAAQARAAMREQPGHRMAFTRRPGAPPPAGDRQVIQRPPRRAAVQMLDKSGVATLLRLMFIFQQGSLRSTLNSVLQNISENRHNRNEILSTILHILQDGSLHITAVERSFAQLSLRAKQPKDAQSKTPIPLKKSLTGGLGSLTQINIEASPLLVVQQCLTCLVYLNQVNPHIPAFFLTEHDTGAGAKRGLGRKGKGKENQAAKYALNSLLSLLDRDLIMESSSVMESLSALLNMITAPLQALQRKQLEVERAKAISEAPASEGALEPTPEAATPAASVEAPNPGDSQQTDSPAEIQPVLTSTEAPNDAEAVETTAVQANTAAEGGEPSDSMDVAKPASPFREPEKKQRRMVPPVVPEHNLKLVINIFVARECSSKTFRETLSTIKNLSAIPDAKAVFGKELIAKAQRLGETILIDLEELLPQIRKATTGNEIQGVALAKFSPGGSDQNKLLRVLTALDHLFDPKREKKDHPTGVETDGESSELVEKQDLLASLYKNSTFGPMWERLSACLSAIRQREDMLNVATILLPLIESLMVVCKNTTLKDAPMARSQLGKEMVLTSPPPENRMESLFFTFTEEHRKILNDLVRQTPKLMSGTFSLLVKNPKVLEFDNKRNYFSRSIHSKAPNSRQSFPPLQLSVRRDQVFHDSFKSLYFQTGDQMKYGKLSIRFHGEEGVDAGGVTREWFQVLSRQMFDPGYALFIPVSSDRTTFHPNQLSSVNEEHLMFFKFIGRIIGKALYEGRVLDCHFSRAVYKRILGKAVSVKDMESLDPDYYKSLIWMLENDITDIITETFSVDNDKFGVVETIDFIPNGRNIPVTEENKHEYVRLMVEWKLTGSVKEQLDEFLKGFHEIIPAELVSIFNEQELELLISGLPEIDVDDWKSTTEYHNYSASSPQIQWFWRAVRSFDKEERAKLLQFVTGTSKVPLNGFKELEGMNGFSRFNIHRDYGNKERLPSSHTCFNQLDLPEYESYEALRQQVLTAITAGSEYFGFA